jgi:ELWxxDGT repeat protein
MMDSRCASKTFAFMISAFFAGTLAAQAQSPPFAPYHPMDKAWLGSVKLCAASDPLHGVELWRFDASDNGYLIADLWPGPSGSYPKGFTAMNGVAFFNANDGEHGTELWRSDGTAEGTYLVSDISAGAAGSNPRLLTPLGAALFFKADDGVHGEELWTSDGTAAGTKMVRDLVPGPEGSSPVGLTAYHGKIIFSALDGLYGAQLNSRAVLRRTTSPLPMASWYLRRTTGFPERSFGAPTERRQGRGWSRTSTMGRRDHGQII